jgi:hypothetical protein
MSLNPNLVKTENSGNISGNSAFRNYSGALNSSKQKMIRLLVFA